MYGKLSKRGLGLLLSSCLAAVVDQFSSGLRLTGSSFGIAGRNATYDYVVVGGGVAGSVAAARLAEKNLSVALVEAGGFYGPSSTMRLHQ
jgi:choline dehydrogenase